MSEPSCPAPSWTNARKPAAYIVSTRGRKRTGSSRWRMNSSRIAAGSSG
nr:hypothetical protein HEP87_40180 [Streptomyces sp. S1D4-11]